MSVPCFGIEFLGQCSYDPSAPTVSYFSLGEVVAALAFTFAIQQFLKPIYRFRLRAHGLRISHIYAIIFAGVFAVILAVLVPNIPIMHGGPWGYAIVWEVIAALLFVAAYGTVVLVMLRPVRVSPTRIDVFAQGAAMLLSSANENDHVDLAEDLRKSLPTIVESSAFAEDRSSRSAFYDFVHRNRVRQSAFAHSLLLILADPALCKTLIKRLPWQVSFMLGSISDRELYSRAAELFVQELARQAISHDDGMMEREIGFYGFGSAPILSESLFSDLFIVYRYNPIGPVFSTTQKQLTPSALRRFNSAARRCFETLIAGGRIDHSYIAYGIQGYYRSAFMEVRRIQNWDSVDFRFNHEMIDAVGMVIKSAEMLLASVSERRYETLFVDDPGKNRSDLLEVLTNIVFEALASVANKFQGVDDDFWSMSIEAIHEVFHPFGEEPDGLTPFQQRFLLKLIGKVQDNMRGYYPAISRVLIACVGPYESAARQPNLTAHNILREALYSELKKLQKFSETGADKLRDYLPDSDTYDPATNVLTHKYSSGNTASTNLGELDLKVIDLLDVKYRRILTDEECRLANFH